MSHIYNQCLLHFVDINGKRTCAFLTTQDQSSGGASTYAPLAAAIQAVTSCGLVAIQFQTTVVVDAAASDGDYPSVFDKAVILVPIDGENRSSRLEIPGPKSEIFLSNHVTVDLTNTLVEDVQAQGIALLGDADGHPWGPFKRGTRQRARGG